MKILLPGHHDFASNVALALIVAELPGHRFDVRLSGGTSRGLREDDERPVQSF